MPLLLEQILYTLQPFLWFYLGYMVASRNKVTTPKHLPNNVIPIRRVK